MLCKNGNVNKLLYCIVLYHTLFNKHNPTDPIMGTAIILDLMMSIGCSCCQEVNEAEIHLC